MTDPTRTNLRALDASESDPRERESQVDLVDPVDVIYGGPGKAITVFELALGAGWLLLPAIQYYGTFQRTELQIEGSASMPALATLDLTPLYFVLLAGTLGLFSVRWMRAVTSIGAIQAIQATQTASSVPTEAAAVAEDPPERERAH